MVAETRVLKDNIKVVVNEVGGECITSVGYKTIARGVLKALGKDICKLLVNEFNNKDNKK